MACYQQNSRVRNRCESVPKAFRETARRTNLTGLFSSYSAVEMRLKTERPLMLAHGKTTSGPTPSCPREAMKYLT